MKTNRSGFGMIAVIAILLSAGICLIGYKLISSNRDNPNKNSPTVRQQLATPEDNGQKIESKSLEDTSNYLVIKELGVKLPLIEETKDAYYVVNKHEDPTIPPLVSLSVHSLDQFPDCRATTDNPGIAGISTFEDGQTNPVYGDFSVAFPEAPKIKGRYYFVTRGHYDCTLQQATETQDKARGSFAQSYSGIKEIPE